MEVNVNKFILGDLGEFLLVHQEILTHCVGQLVCSNYVVNYQNKPTNMETLVFHWTATIYPLLSSEMKAGPCTEFHLVPQFQG